MSDHNWSNKSDDELIAIINSLDIQKHPNEIRNAARSELHKRQKRKDNYMLYMTLIILILTSFLVYAEFFHKPTPATIPALNMQPQQLNPTEKKETPRAKHDVPKVITHSSTSIKQK